MKPSSNCHTVYAKGKSPLFSGQPKLCWSVRCRRAVKLLAISHMPIQPAARAGRAVIRLMENTTGRLRLIKRADGYEEEVARGRDFWDVMVERYGLTLDVVGGSLDNIPKDGPLILIANHPYGILDGLMMGHILSEVRGDFRIMAHRIFRKAEELNRIILPVSFDETKEAVKLNLQTAKRRSDTCPKAARSGSFRAGRSAHPPSCFRIPWIRVGAVSRPGWLESLMPPSFRFFSKDTPRACFRLRRICTQPCGWAC